jgi:hypothetical protein
LRYPIALPRRKGAQGCGGGYDVNDVFAVTLDGTRLQNLGLLHTLLAKHLLVGHHHERALHLGIEDQRLFAPSIGHLSREEGRSDAGPMRDWFRGTLSRSAARSALADSLIACRFSAALLKAILRSGLGPAKPLRQMSPLRTVASPSKLGSFLSGFFSFLSPSKPNDPLRNVARCCDHGVVGHGRQSVGDAGWCGSSLRPLLPPPSKCEPLQGNHHSSAFGVQ